MLRKKGPKFDLASGQDPHLRQATVGKIRPAADPVGNSPGRSAGAGALGRRRPSAGNVLRLIIQRDLEAGVMKKPVAATEHVALANEHQIERLLESLDVAQLTALLKQIEELRESRIGPLPLRSRRPWPRLR